MFTLQNLLETDRKPAPYEPGAEFWNDPYIAGQLLAAHLDPATDQASYRPETLQAICRYLPARLGLAPNAALVDLGCGPGLYCAALSRQGYQMTGIDRSESSLAYAAAHAPQAQFLRQSYLEPFGTERFDAAIMISEDFGVLNPAARQALLKNIHAALKPGGYFAFDVPSLRAFQARTEGGAPNWYAATGGLFRPHPHFVLEKPIAYPAIPALCNTYAVFDTALQTYRFWMTFFSPDTIRKELAEANLKVTAVLADLTGTPYTPDSQSLGVLCQKS